MSVEAFGLLKYLLRDRVPESAENTFELILDKVPDENINQSGEVQTEEEDSS